MYLCSILITYSSKHRISRITLRLQRRTLYLFCCSKRYQPVTEGNPHFQEPWTKTKQPSTKMQCAQRSVLFLSMLVLALSSEADQSPDSMDLGQDLEQDLDMELARHRLLQRARTAGLLTQSAVEDLLLAQMSLPETNALEPALSKETVGHVTHQRSVETNNLPPRERKAGCKNFYWKGLTSC